jgi:PucR C-terminal helix-turn-helix domain/GGDEF-like domain
VSALDASTGWSAPVDVVVPLREQRAELIARGVERIRTEIPAYAAIDDPHFVADVREHVALHHDAAVGSLELGRALVAADLTFVPAHASRRVGRVPLLAFLQAFQIYTEELWDTIVSSADTESSRRAALDAAGILIHYMNGAAAEAGSAYAQAELLVHTYDESARREAIEDLLAGRPAKPGPRLTATREAGLTPDGPCVLVAAVPLAPHCGVGELRAAAAAISRAVGAPQHPLTAVRNDEVIVVAPVDHGLEPLLERMPLTQQTLAAEGIALAIGVSTVHPGLERLDEAHAEALMALDRVRDTGGVVALPALSALDCLAYFGRETARRRIPPAITRFLTEDAAAGGALTATLLEYVAADLNAKVTAARLFIHPNTARYRLDRIAGRTGCDLRRIADVVDVLVAIRVAH